MVSSVPRPRSAVGLWRRVAVGVDDEPGFGAAFSRFAASLKWKDDIAVIYEEDRLTPDSEGLYTLDPQLDLLHSRLN